MEQIKRKRTIYEVVFKRPLDFILSLLTLIILSPVMIIVAILVKIKLGGPVIFKQQRPGKNEKIFNIYKFRTMTNELDKDGNLLPDKDRITKFGQVLRKLSIDELPSLLNILKGDISIVGPRPLMPSYLNYYTPKEKQRHLVRPGLTGLAQVSGRNVLTWEERFDYDLKYIEKITFFGDTKIIFKTFIKVLKREDIVDSKDPEIRKPLNIQREKKYSEIGSVFWLNKNNFYFQNKKSNRYIFNKVPKIKDVVYTSSGRSAIKLVLNEIKLNNRVALLPAYTCGSVIKPFIEENFKIQYFNLNENMEVSIKEIIEMADIYKPSILLFHQYFGFETNKNISLLIRELKKRNIKVIEDITQNLYSNYKFSDADYYIASPRKWYALPDGGLVISANKKIKTKTNNFNHKLIENKIEGFHLKYLYMEERKGNKEVFYKKIQNSEKLVDTNIYKMSNISKLIMNNVNIEIMNKKRKINYNILYNQLKDNSKIKIIFNDHLNDYTPLYFPIIVNERVKLQNFLAQNNIYAPIIWNKSNYINSEKLSKSTIYLYENMLCLPIDQRYNSKDMIKILNIIEKFYKEV